MYRDGLRASLRTGCVPQFLGPSSLLSTVHRDIGADDPPRHLCLSTGEALDIDLSDFINRLYALLPQLALMPDIESAPAPHTTGVRGPPPQSSADVLFRALELAFTPRATSAPPPSWRTAAFAKRLLSAALHWPPGPAARALALVAALVERDPKLEALLATEDRAGNGVYRADVDDPQVANAFGSALWELRVLAERHWAGRVRGAARQMLESRAPHASSLK